MARLILSAFALCTVVALASECPEDSKPPAGANLPEAPPPAAHNWAQYVPSSASPAKKSFNWKQFVPTMAPPANNAAGSFESFKNLSQSFPAGVAKYMDPKGWAAYSSNWKKGSNTMAIAQCYSWAKAPDQASSTREICAWREGQLLISNAYTPKEYSGGFNFGVDDQIKAGMTHLNNISKGLIQVANCSGTIYKFDANPPKQNAADCTTKSELDAWYKQAGATVKQIVPPVGVEYALASVKSEYDLNLRRIEAPSPTLAPTTIAPPEVPNTPVQTAQANASITAVASNTGMVHASLKKTPLALAAAPAESSDAANGIPIVAIVGVAAFALSLTAAAGLWLQGRRERPAVDAEVSEEVAEYCQLA